MRSSTRLLLVTTTIPKSTSLSQTTTTSWALRQIPTLKTTTQASTAQDISQAQDTSINTFRTEAFNANKPALLPAQFTTLPALSKWVTPGPNPHFSAYLSTFSATVLPTEVTTKDPGSSKPHLLRHDAPLSFFLQYASLACSSNSPSSPIPPKQPSAPTTTFLIAQSPLPLLPPSLLADIPTPPHVRLAGKGDVYTSSLWLGVAPTATPLHRDPNPNLLVQIAGRKKVRLLRPADGARIFGSVRERVGRGLLGEKGQVEGQGQGQGQGWDRRQEGGEKIRGAEMMVGEEGVLLEDLVWGQGRAGDELGDGEWRVEREGVEMWEGEIGPGDGVFIPTGWWHAVRGVGEGAVVSVNWWFR